MDLYNIDRLAMYIQGVDNVYDNDDFLPDLPDNPDSLEKPKANPKKQKRLLLNQKEKQRRAFLTGSFEKLRRILDLKHATRQTVLTQAILYIQFLESIHVKNYSRKSNI